LIRRAFDAAEDEHLPVVFVQRLDRAEDDAARLRPARARDDAGRFARQKIGDRRRLLVAPFGAAEPPPPRRPREERRAALEEGRREERQEHRRQPSLARPKRREFREGRRPRLLNEVLRIGDAAQGLRDAEAGLRQEERGEALDDPFEGAEIARGRAPYVQRRLIAFAFGARFERGSVSGTHGAGSYQRRLTRREVKVARVPDPSTLAVVAAFLERCCADLEDGALLPLDEYLRIFPGHDDALREVFRTLVADDDSTDGGGDPFAEDEILGGRFVLIGPSRRDGGTTMRAAADRVTNDVVEVRAIRAPDSGYDVAVARFRVLASIGAGEAGASARAEGALLPLDGGEIPGAGAWIATPRSSGVPLSDAPPPNDAPEALDRAIGVARALAAASAAGVVHGDLRPARVFLREDGGVDVAHFGLGASAPELLFGPLLTEAAPEAARHRSPARLLGGGPSEGDDVRAAATLLFEQATGVPPFDAPTDEALRRVVAKEPPRARSVRADVPSGLDAVLRRALKPDAAYADARSWLDALVALQSGRPDSARRSWFLRLLGR
jgi:hypothetical protein